MTERHSLTEEVVFRPPDTYEDALEERRRLIAEVEALQSELAGRASDLSWRIGAINELRRKHALLRRIKEWLRQNDRTKDSEWRLVARAYRLLVELEMSARSLGRGDELELLLDAIETAIPKKFLAGDE